MIHAPQGARFGRAPPSLRRPPAITAIDLPKQTYRKIWTQLGMDLLDSRSSLRAKGNRNSPADVREKTPSFLAVLEGGYPFLMFSLPSSRS
jgi:hypothetical protein